MHCIHYFLLGTPEAILKSNRGLNSQVTLLKDEMNSLNSLIGHPGHLDVEFYNNAQNQYNIKIKWT